MPQRACRLAVFFLAAATVAFAVETAPNPSLKVSYDKAKDSLSVEARAASLGELLRAIGKSGGIEIRLDQDAEKPVSIKFTGLTMEQGLGYIGEEASLSYALFVSREKAEGGEAARRISGMWVVEAGSGKGGSPSGHPASSVSTGSPVEHSQQSITPTPIVHSDAPPLSPEEVAAAKANATRERLERRLANLPPAERERVIKADEERARRREERMSALAKAREERRKTVIDEAGITPENVNRGGK